MVYQDLCGFTSETLLFVYPNSLERIPTTIIAVVPKSDGFLLLSSEKFNPSLSNGDEQPDLTMEF